MKKHLWKPTTADFLHLYAMAEGALQNIHAWETMGVEDWMLYRRRDVANLISTVEYLLTGTMPMLETCLPPPDKALLEAGYRDLLKILESAMDGVEDDNKMMDACLDLQLLKHEVVNGECR